MSNGYIKIDRSRTPSRRGCGWGSALTTCAKCGKIMLGHNKGVCSKCAREDGTRRPAERVIFARHLGYHAFERDLANGARELAFAKSPQAQKPTAEEVRS